MATLALGLKPCAITIGLFSGTRQPFPAGEQVLLTVRDGNQQQVFRDYVNKPSFTLSGLPFHNNFGDNYTVVAWAKGCAQAGFTPVKVTPALPASLDLMLVREDAQFNFSEARWGVISQESPLCHAVDRRDGEPGCGPRPLHGRAGEPILGPGLLFQPRHGHGGDPSCQRLAARLHSRGDLGRDDGARPFLRLGGPGPRRPGDPGLGERAVRSRAGHRLSFIPARHAVTNRSSSGRPMYSSRSTRTTPGPSTAPSASNSSRISTTTRTWARTR